VDRVHVASDGEQALEFLQSELIDLVLLDLMLPGMGGWSPAATSPAPRPCRC
jgi:CheY-like chemotaxis protein